MSLGMLDFIEEPIRDESPEAYESLHKLIDLPFAIGEEFTGKWQFYRFYNAISPNLNGSMSLM